MPRRQSTAFRSDEENKMAVILKVIVFFQSLTSDGLGTFVNVYLVVILGWSPLKAAWVSFARDMFSVCAQSFVGAFVDSTKNKKILIALISATKIAIGIILMTTSNFAALIIKGLLDGVDKITLIPVITAMTLGSVGKTRFHRKHAAVNLMVANIGKGFGSALLGGIAYAIYPNIKNAFSLFIAAGIVSLLLLCVMPNEAESVNAGVARGRSIFIRSMSKLLVEKESDDEEDEEFSDEEDAAIELEATDTKEAEATRTSDTKGVREAGLRQAVRNGRTQDAEITRTMTIREMLSDPERKKSLICLFLVFFTFHLANAAVLPLLGQYLGKEDKDRDALPITSALTVISSSGAFFMNWYLKSNLRMVGYRNVLLFGCGALTFRLILISVLVKFTDNLWAIGSTNFLDGLGVGSLDLMLALYSHLLSRQTGRYNLNMAFITTGKELGAALSVVIGGAIATYASYEIAFVTLTVMTILPIVFSFGVLTPSLHGNVE